MSEAIRKHVPVLIIGGGLAGCTTALALADAGIPVTMVATGERMDGGNSAQAQGGIVFKAGNDDARLLEQDIITAGHGHNYRKAVRFLCEQGPEVVQKVLVERLQVPFERHQKPADDWDLTLEGGHGVARILHCADFTGKAIMDCLGAAIRENPLVSVLTHRTSIDLLTTHHHAHDTEFRYQLQNQCVGAYVYNEQTNAVETIFADHTVLATGGVGQLYLHTTNSDPSIGSGLAMAQRAGVRLENLEYVQFHPTAFYHQSMRRFLVSEAVRGEGGRLINAQGQHFMPQYDKRGDLAPRDIVSQSIVTEMYKSGDACVYLDTTKMTHDPEVRFPTIYKFCKDQGIDMHTDPVPVVPAAHYFCGGILVDQAGQTSLDRLFAVGECSCTGLHGANRLASTSLLEALLWGHSAGQIIARQAQEYHLTHALQQAVPDWTLPTGKANDDPALIAQDWSTIKHTMWNYVGISRTTSRLKRAFETFRDLSRYVHDFYKLTPMSKPLIDLFHGCQAAYLITISAMLNKKSLGCHYRKD